MIARVLPTFESAMKAPDTPSNQPPDTKPEPSQPEAENPFDHLEVSRDYYRLLPGNSANIQVFGVKKDGTKQDITKDKQLTFESDNTSILQVKNGKMQAGKISGTANVTISYLGNRTTISGTVSSTFPKSFKADPSQYTLTLGQVSSLYVEATYLDNTITNISRSMEWKADDPSIVTINGTQITGVYPGTTKLTGTYAEDFGKVVINVTVTLKPLSKLEPSATRLTLNAGESRDITIKGIKSVKSPDTDLTSLVQWIVSTPAVLTVSNGHISAVSRGSATVTADYYGLKTTIAVTVQ